MSSWMRISGRIVAILAASAACPAMPQSAHPRADAVHKDVAASPTIADAHALFGHLTNGELTYGWARYTGGEMTDEVTRYEGVGCSSTFTLVSGSTFTLDWTKASKVYGGEIGFGGAAFPTHAVMVDGPVRQRAPAEFWHEQLGEPADSPPEATFNRWDIIPRNDVVEGRITRAMTFLIEHCAPASAF